MQKTLKNVFVNLQLLRSASIGAVTVEDEERAFLGDRWSHSSDGPSLQIQVISSANLQRNLCARRVDTELFDFEVYAGSLSPLRENFERNL